jgi:hypothetical protein
LDMLIRDSSNQKMDENSTWQLAPNGHNAELGGQPRGYQIFRSFKDLLAPCLMSWLGDDNCQALAAWFVDAISWDFLVG